MGITQLYAHSWSNIETIRLASTISYIFFPFQKIFDFINQMRKGTLLQWKVLQHPRGREPNNAMNVYSLNRIAIILRSIYQFGRMNRNHGH